MTDPTPPATMPRAMPAATLVIETATAACSAALIADGQILAAHHEVVGRGHAERLIPMIALLLDGRPAPSRILVDCGPGSFTGIRVGLAAARALGLGWRVPVAGFSSLALLAAMAAAAADDPARIDGAAVGGSDDDAALERSTGDLVVAMAGGHGELFVQPFHLAPLRPAAALRSLRPEVAATAFPALRVTGPGATLLATARGGPPAPDVLPDARAAILLPADLADLPPVPIYGRAPDARPPAPAGPPAAAPRASATTAPA